MNQQTPAEVANDLLKEEQKLLAAKGQIADETRRIDDRLSVVRAAIEGLKLGRALAAQEAEQAAAAQTETTTEE